MAPVPLVHLALHRSLLLQPIAHQPTLVPALLLQLHPFMPAVCVGSPTTLHLLPDLHAHPSQAPLLVFRFPPLVGFHLQVVLLALVVPVDLVDPVVPLLCRLL